MAPPKASPSTPTNPKVKKGSKTLMVTLKLSPKRLMKFPHQAPVVAEIEPVASIQPPPSDLPDTSAAVASPSENVSESNSNTPAASGPDNSGAMPPPPAVTKKSGKGAKKPIALIDGVPKPRGKPGPKKKLKLEDGTLAPAFAAVPKLGPKANQGAINERLRQLDRTGTPCRKWQKGSFKIKTFTGTVWEIPRWHGLAKNRSNEGAASDSSLSGSGKENKEGSHLDSEADKSNSTDIENKSSASIPPSSPAAFPVPAVAAEAA